MPIDLDYPKAPSTNELLHEFLTKWEAVRTGQIAKYQASADHWYKKTGGAFLSQTALRKVQHYQHELKMLQELRQRAGV